MDFDLFESEEEAISLVKVHYRKNGFEGIVELLGKVLYGLSLQQKVNESASVAFEIINTMLKSLVKEVEEHGKTLDKSSKSNSK